MAGRKKTKGRVKQKAPLVRWRSPSQKSKAIEKLLGGLPPLALSPEEEALSVVGYENIVAAVGGESGGVDFLRRWESLRMRLRRFLALLSENGWAAALNAADLTHTHTSLLSSVDPDGFGALLTAAAKIWDAKCQQRATDELYRRAIDGYDEPVFGRVGVGEDGVIGKKRVYSDRLLALAVERRNRAFQKEEKSAKVTIGQQTVYNLGDLQEAVTVDVDAVEDVEIE